MRGYKYGNLLPDEFLAGGCGIWPQNVRRTSSSVARERQPISTPRGRGVVRSCGRGFTRVFGVAKALADLAGMVIMDA